MSPLPSQPVPPHPLSGHPLSGHPLVVVGDALLDRDLDGRVERLAPDAPVPVVDEPVSRVRPGGAGLAALLAAAGPRPVRLVTALGDDDTGAQVRVLLAAAGVEVVDVGLDGPTPEKVRVRAAGRALVRLDYGGRDGRPRPAGAAVTAALDDAAAVLVSDYGRGLTADRGLRRALTAAAQRCPVVWDPHPRGSAPVAGVRLATPNRDEAARLVPDGGDASAGRHTALAVVTARARALLARWQAAGVVVTLGADGALLVGPDGTPLAVPAPAVLGDPCGAGDRFSSRAALALADGALPSEAVASAVATASAFVAAGGAGAVSQSPDAASQRFGAERGADRVVDVRDGAADDTDAFALAERVRAAGGTVVATGGCFDLLHAGHVRMLAAARALGDCLVVCLNSDDSVRQLKGRGRPLVGEADRRAVLSALDSVDAVVVFSERTPEAILARLRPHVWAKGADYAVADLPEAALLSRWGGQAVVLPYLDGHSTTRLLEAARS